MNFPNKIICLTEESVETLFEIGKGDLIIGVSHYVKRPLAATKLPKVSAFTKSNCDKIVSMKPDLVLGYSDIQKDIAKELIAKGLNVFIANHQSLAGIINYIRLLSNMVQASKEGEELIVRLKRKMDQARAFAKTLKSKPKVYFEEWDDPIISSITWVTELLELCGGEVIFPNQENLHLAQDRVIKLEDLIQRNPDIIFACWCGKKFNQDNFLKRDSIETTNAVQKKQIFELDPAIYLQPGPAPILSGIDEIITIYQNWANLDT